MASRKLGETKGPLITWLFVMFYFALLNLLASGSSSSGTMPETLTLPLVLSLLVSMARSYGVILVFLVVFVALWEKQRTLRGIFFSLGLRGTGTVKSIFWSVIMFPLLAVIGFLSMMLISSLGAASVLNSASNGVQAPAWYLWYMVLYSFFPVAVVEEIWARGYMLDRLMPQHPSGLVKASGVILLSSLLFALWHLPSFLRSYSTLMAVCVMMVNVFPISIVLSIAYVRAGTRNVIGPIIMHFLLDAIPIILILTTRR